MERQAAYTKEHVSGSPPAIPDHKLLNYIGCGGYGEVWLARSSLGAYRAVKIIYRSSFTDEKPFERELSGIRKFEPISRSHEGFVDVLQVGINEPGGYFYYIMELGDDVKTGQAVDPATYTPRTLKQELAERGRLGASECMKLGLALSQALHELHGAGFVHRDIKPANIIFVNGVPKLADIGLVADVNEARSMVGTVGYIPPEGPGTKQADVYGLGKTLYQASTGNDCTMFPEFPTLVDHFPEREKFLELNEVVMRACNPEPSLRYDSVQAMNRELLVLMSGESIIRLHLLERWFSRLKWVVPMSAVLVALLLAAWYIVDRQRKATSAARQRAVGVNVASGIQAMNSGDLLGALPHFTEALVLESEDSSRASAERLRLGSVLDQCPKLTHLWSGAGPVTSGQFSPDGTQVLLARFCGNVEVHNLLKGPPRVLKPPPTLINAAYSHDGRLLVTVSQSSVACIWEAGKFSEVRRLPHASKLWSARFSPDGLRVVTGASDGVARVWNVKTGELVFALKHADAVRFCDFSHDGKLLITASNDGTARLWNAETGEPAGAPLDHGAWVTSAAFSPDDQKVVTGCLDHKARVWEIHMGRRLLPDLIHGDAVQSVEFSPDGRMILTASGDGCARLWMTENQQPARVDPVLRHPGPVTQASFSPESRRVLTTCADGSVRIWDLAGGAGRPVVGAGGFSADGNRFLTVVSNRVQVYDTVSGQAVCPPLVSQMVLQRVRLIGNGRFLVTVSSLEAGSTNHSVQVWDADRGQRLGPGIKLQTAAAGVSLATQGDRVVIFEDNHVQTWDVRAGSPLSPLLRFKQPVIESVFSRDGKHVASLSGNEVRVWDARSGWSSFEPLRHTQPVRVAAFSPDDELLAVGCSDNRLTASYGQVYSARTGHTSGAYLNHGAGVLCVAFSPDSRRIVTASADFTASVWDVVTGRLMTPRLRHENQVRQAAFSPDGRWVITACADKTARVWDAETGEPATPKLRSLGPLARAEFLADQGHVVAVGEEGNGEVWKISLEARPLGELLSLVRVLSGAIPAGVDGGPAGPLDVVWQRLRREYPGDFTTSAESIAAWHEFAAQDGELGGQWEAAAFHLGRLRLLRTNNPSVASQLARAQEHLLRGD